MRITEEDFEYIMNNARSQFAMYNRAIKGHIKGQTYSIMDSFEFFLVRVAIQYWVGRRKEDEG